MEDSISRRIGITTAIIITLFSILSVVSADYDSGFNSNVQRFTRNITLKQGSLRGIVVRTRLRGGYVPVEQYLGIPYAAPPVGHLRFMPPQASPYWKGDKFADNFGPVCPQDLPDTANMEPNRKEYFRRLKQEYLTNESEDCLYLNIYGPYQGMYVGVVVTVYMRM
ncbi:Carboxylesterase family [Popillia japonica]|uniref:Carboxylesterase family n=1 Tax=Popillia japonica TaxID=7064 RepID=A0AAW1MDC5_POPJA